MIVQQMNKGYLHSTVSEYKQEINDKKQSSPFIRDTLIQLREIMIERASSAKVEEVKFFKESSTSMEKEMWIFCVLH